MEFTRVLCDQYPLTFVRNVLENVYIKIFQSKIILRENYSISNGTSTEMLFGIVRLTLADPV